MRSLGRAALLILDDWAQLDAWDRQTLLQDGKLSGLYGWGTLDSNQN